MKVQCTTTNFVIIVDFLAQNLLVLLLEKNYLDIFGPQIYIIGMPGCTMQMLTDEQTMYVRYYLNPYIYND